MRSHQVARETLSGLGQGLARAQRRHFVGATHPLEVELLHGCRLSTKTAGRANFRDAPLDGPDS
jgi:hypothetical protein